MENNKNWAQSLWVVYYVYLGDTNETSVPLTVIDGVYDTGKAATIRMVQLEKHEKNIYVSYRKVTKNIATPAEQAYLI